MQFNIKSSKSFKIELGKKIGLLLFLLVVFWLMIPRTSQAVAPAVGAVNHIFDIDSSETEIEVIITPLYGEEGYHFMPCRAYLGMWIVVGIPASKRMVFIMTENWVTCLFSVFGTRTQLIPPAGCSVLHLPVKARVTACANRMIGRLENLIGLLSAGENLNPQKMLTVGAPQLPIYLAAGLLKLVKFLVRKMLIIFIMAVCFMNVFQAPR